MFGSAYAIPDTIPEAGNAPRDNTGKAPALLKVTCEWQGDNNRKRNNKEDNFRESSAGKGVKLGDLIDSDWQDFREVLSIMTETEVTPDRRRSHRNMWGER